MPAANKVPVVVIAPAYTPPVVVVENTCAPTDPVVVIFPVMFRLLGAKEPPMARLPPI